MDTTRSFTREFCQPQYDPFLTAPDARQVNDKRLRLAAQARASLASHLDIAYGAGRRAQLDIYPAHGESRDVLIYLHGGYWRSMDKQHYAFIAPSFVSAGCMLVLPNYDLAPEATLDAIVDQVRAACAWAWHNIGGYGGDRERISIGGNSAGAHLAAMMAVTDWPSVDSRLPRDLMKSGVMLSGLYDIEPLLFTSVNDALALDVAAARRNSPVRRPPTVQGPLLLAVGERESDEFRRQTRLLERQWETTLAIRSIVVADRHHFDLPLDLADAGSALFSAARDTMRAGLGEAR